MLLYGVKFYEFVTGVGVPLREVAWGSSDLLLSAPQLLSAMRF